MNRTGKHPDKQLTAVGVRNIAKQGRYADGNGLYLIVDASGNKRWVQRLLVRGQRRDIGLGSARLVTLAEARDKAIENRRVTRAGGDPIAERDRAKRITPTFEQMARRLHESLRPSWKNPKHAAQWINTLDHYVFPHFGAKRVDQVTTDDVKGALLSIWHDKPETARRVRQRVRLVMEAVIESKHRIDNPAFIRVGLPVQAKQPQHHVALPYSEVPAFVRGIRGDAADVAKLALEFVILTATRSNEVIGARWSEIEIQNATWTIPAARMKAKIAHRVPLAPRALVILEQAKRLSDGDGYVFPGRVRGKPLSNMTLLKVVRRMGATATVHGFRSSFRDWTEELTSFSNNVCESALAHTVKDKAERAYRRTDHFVQRKALMATWAEFVAGESTNVVRLRGKEATAARAVSG